MTSNATFKYFHWKSRDLMNLPEFELGSMKYGKIEESSVPVL